MSIPKWSVGGRLIELDGEYEGDLAKVLIDGVPVPGAEVPADGHEVTIPFEGKELTFIRTSRFLRIDAELFLNCQKLPCVAAKLPIVRPSEGTRCPNHSDTRATIVCTRCGTFACPKCAAIDETHCQACVDVLLAVRPAKKPLTWRTPLWVLLGCVCGWFLGRAAWRTFYGPVGTWVAGDFGLVVGGMYALARDRGLRFAKPAKPRLPNPD